MNIDKFTGESDIYYPAGNENIDINVLNNNTKLLDEKKLEMKDLNDIAKETTSQKLLSDTEYLKSNIDSANSAIQNIYNETNTNSVSYMKGKVNQIYSWFSSIYNELADTSTNYMKGKINQIYNWVNSIYNETSNTSTSYTKGKINQIYNWINNMYSWLSTVYSRSASIYNETTSSNTSYMNGQVQAMYNKINSSGLGIKKVQRGVINYAAKSKITGYYKVYISSVNPSKSILLISTNMIKWGDSYKNDELKYQNLTSNYFEVAPIGYNALPAGEFGEITFSWQVVEFY